MIEAMTPVLAVSEPGCHAAGHDAGAASEGGFSMMGRTRLGLAAAVFSLLATPAAAHHGWSGYDQNKELTLDGTIAESGYEHPHGHVRLTAGDKTWVVTLAPPSRMERRGLASSALTTGTKARVVGYPSRTDPNEMRAERIIIDGKTTELR